MYFYVVQQFTGHILFLRSLQGNIQTAENVVFVSRHQT